MFFLYAVARPILASDNTTTTSTLFSNASDACRDISDCRTISDIFLSCFTVVFISVWVSMHPDVPHVEHVGNSDVGNFLNQLIIMTLSFLFPELIAGWALRQRKEAGKLETKYKKYGWTKAHGYLAIMGGLALYDKDGKFRGYLDDEEGFSNDDRKVVREIEESLAGRPPSVSKFLLKPSILTHYVLQVAIAAEEPSCLLDYMLSRGLVDLTQPEIKATLSHGYIFAKLSALLSTGWFLVQILARAVQGLVITELEVVTLSFTMLNIAAYAIWWDKPQRVRFPVRVTWVPRLRTPPEAANRTSTQRLFGWAPQFWRELRGRLVAVFKRVVFEDIAVRERRGMIWRRLSVLGLYPFIFLSYRFDSLAGIYDTRRERRMNVSIFVEDTLPKSEWRWIPLGMVVGAPHFVAWSSQFPAASMRIAWLTSASVLIAMPVLFWPVILIAAKVDNLTASWLSVQNLMFLLWMICYAVARLTPVVLGILIPLRYGLPESAYHAVDWTKYIPHIG
ncbi:hypothetical protein V5O48_007457 [Marasmius crinis-equi]|uniref:Uncharacterized protein n=1 Tax=Marasmius crinis-equi TaxID=585013 RepID=A0ABR3FGV5_9AGAR